MSGQGGQVCSVEDDVEIDVQERLEGSIGGRVVISVLCLVVVGAAILSNLPANSAIKRTYEPWARPVINTMGLNQSWDVFSPDPRRLTFELYAIVEFDDGSRARWRPPKGDPFVSGYRTYRWRKWVEWARADDRRDELWRPTAVFVAQQLDGGGRRPVKVSLVRRWHDTPPPGTRRTEPRWNEFTYFTLDISREMLR